MDKGFFSVSQTKKGDGAGGPISRLIFQLYSFRLGGALGFGFRAFERLLAASDAYLGLLRLGLFPPGQFDLQHTVFIVCSYALGVDCGWQSERTREAAVAPLDALEVLLFFFLFKRALPPNRQRLILDLHVKLFLLYPRNFELEYHFVVVFIHIYGRNKAARS